MQLGCWESFRILLMPLTYIYVGNNLCHAAIVMTGPPYNHALSCSLWLSQAIDAAGDGNDTDGSDETANNHSFTRGLGPTI